MKSSKINTVALFSGGGGLDLGFTASGFNIVYSSDIDQYSCNTLKQNQAKKPYLSKHVVECADIRNLTAKHIESQTNVKTDFVIGGPPCQSFSVFGKRKGLEDPRGNLVYEYTRLLEELNPTGFLFENVAGLKTIHGGELYNDLLETLSIKGKYAVSAHEYEVADFGVPQFRRRVFFIGSKKGHAVPHMEPTHTNPKSLFNAHKAFRTVGEVLSEMPKPITNWKDSAPINGHVGRNHSDRIVERYDSLTHGERDHKTRINKLNPERPSYTIIVGSDKGGGKGHVHPYAPREVTPRESARIQTFPDWWEFYGTGRHIIRQVGNAVPPLFGAILGNHIKRSIFGEKKSFSYDQFIEKLEIDFLKDGN
ncbi:DNA cytosine methyltransferase [Roseivirga echinicomitans]